MYQVPGRQDLRWRDKASFSIRDTGLLAIDMPRSSAAVGTLHHKGSSASFLVCGQADVCRGGFIVSSLTAVRRWEG